MPDGTYARTPNVARIYDYLLGGKDNYEEDRNAAERLLEAVPDAAVAAWDNRQFLGRAVEFLVREAGIRQIVDVGTGLPTRGNVHAIAHRLAPASRIAYVDNDPIVIAHANALLNKHSSIAVVEGDIRDPRRALPLTSGTSLAGCPVRGRVLQVRHDAVCECLCALSATKPLV